MSSPFGNEEFRFGSACPVGADEMFAKGMFTASDTALYIGEFENKPLWYHGDGGLLLCGGARSGKLTTILAYNLCHGIYSGGSMLVLDVKGELAAISRNQAPDLKACRYWNPLGLGDLPQNGFNPVDYLSRHSASLFADVKVFAEALVPMSGSANGAFFEERAREYIEAIAIGLIYLNGELTLPDLYDAINQIPSNSAQWIDVAFAMHRSGVPLCVRVEEEIAQSRTDTSGGFQGIMGVVFKSVACLSDPMLRKSLSGPFDGSMSDLCDEYQLCQYYLICPPELISVWAPVLKALFTCAMIHKARRPQAPKQTWILDEAAQLKGFELVTKMFTYGAGIGIRPWIILQSLEQLNDISPRARSIIPSSAGCQSFFAIREIDSARRLSEMLGDQTLEYDDPVQQGRAELEEQQAALSLISGGDPFAIMAILKQKRLERTFRTKQVRRLRKSDEILRLPADHQFIQCDGLSGPIYAQRIPYWQQGWMAGRYHPNPYHPPCDSVLITFLDGEQSCPVVSEPVPAQYNHLPQYRDGNWSYISGF